MALAPGNKLGVYEVTAQIGAGGMGELGDPHGTFRVHKPVRLCVMIRDAAFGSHSPVEGEATMVEPVTLEVFTDYI